MADREQLVGPVPSELHHVLKVLAAQRKVSMRSLVTALLQEAIKAQEK